jgi:hypothetical protein
VQVEQHWQVLENGLAYPFNTKGRIKKLFFLCNFLI